MTTILCVRHNGQLVMCGDGQITLGQSIVVKSNANKLRMIKKHNVVIGFAGSVADAIALFERLEIQLEKHPKQLVRACVELTKLWRTDRALRKLEAMMIVANETNTLILSGDGNVMEPECGVAAIGSGGNYAYSAALALVRNRPDLSAEEIVRESMKIAGEICIYSNTNLEVVVLEHESQECPAG